MDSVRGPRQPSRYRGLSRSAVSGRRYSDRPDRLRHLLRLAVSRSDAPVDRERRRSAGAGLRLHGSVGRDRADELVDDRQSLPRAREHGVRGGGEPGREPATLPAVLLARREPDRRLRRPAAGRRLPRARRAHRRRPDRHHRASPRARHTPRSPDAGASENRGLSGLRGVPVPANGADARRISRGTVIRTQHRADRGGASSRPRLWSRRADVWTIGTDVGEARASRPDGPRRSRRCSSKGRGWRAAPTWGATAR